MTRVRRASRRWSRIGFAVASAAVLLCAQPTPVFGAAHKQSAQKASAAGGVSAPALRASAGTRSPTRGAVLATRAPLAPEPILLSLTEGGGVVNLSWVGSTGTVTGVTTSDRTWQQGIQTMFAEFEGTTWTHPAPTSGIRYLNVVDQETISPAEQNSGYDPRPLPSPPTLVPQGTLWWGRPLTVAASNLDAIVSANHADFYYQSVPAEEPPDEGEVTFTIPEDARSTPYFTLTVNNRTSEAASGPSVNLRAPVTLGGLPLTFSGITSIAYAPCSDGGSHGKVWVADANAIYLVDFFRQDPTAVIVVPTGGPHVLSRATNSGTLLYMSQAVGNPDIYALDQCAAVQTPIVWARTTDAGFHDQVRAAGLAVAPNGSAAFIANAQSGRIVRIPQNAGMGGGAISGNWGNATKTLPTPSGIDAGPTGAVVFAATSPDVTYLIPDGGGSTSSQYPLSFVAHALEIDREASADMPRFFVTSFSGTAEAYNLATSVGGRVQAESGGTLLLDHNLVYWARRPYPQRVFLRGRSGYTFPSPYQRGDRIVELAVEGWGGVPLYVRVVDPPDTSPYAVQPSAPAYHADDNVATLTSATDWGLTDDIGGSNPRRCLAVTPPNDSDPAIFYLKVPEHFAGDNFRVEMSKSSWGEPNCTAANRIVSMTAIYTTWKWIFVERGKMFRRGGLLFEDAAPGAIELKISKVWNGSAWQRADDLEAGDRIAIFDADNPYETPPNLDWPLPGHDEGCVKAVSTGFERYVLVTLGSPSGTTCTAAFAGLTRLYWASPPHTEDHWWHFNTGKSAGVGVVGKTGSGGCDRARNVRQQCFYDLSLDRIDRTYDDAFVEYIA
ncbi:MAG: hypothetical protein ACOY3Y_15955, partial [Acidobacteriota bacterium]